MKRDYQLTTSAFNKPAAGLIFDAGTQIRAEVQDVSDNDTNITFEWHFDEVDV